MSFLANFFLFVGVALLSGLGSAWYMIDRGSALTTDYFGPWVVWTAAGHIEADPYTRAHVARSGRLPMTTSNARYYLATTDGEGDKLDADCEYAITGKGPRAEWWSLAAYDGQGRLMANTADRYAFNSQTVMRSTNGEYTIVLARDARPGNWLPVTSSYRLRLMLRVYHPVLADDRIDSTAEQGELPTIRRLGCR